MGPPRAVGPGKNSQLSHPVSGPDCMYLLNHCIVSGNDLRFFAVSSLSLDTEADVDVTIKLGKKIFEKHAWKWQITWLTLKRVFINRKYQIDLITPNWKSL